MTSFIVWADQSVEHIAEPEASRVDAMPATVRQKVNDMWQDAKLAKEWDVLYTPPGHGRKSAPMHVSVNRGDFLSTQQGYVNDVVINAFLRHLVAMAQRSGVRVAALDTHLYSNKQAGGSLSDEYDLEVLCRKFTRHIEEDHPDGGLLGCDMLIVPIHTGSDHWVLGVVNLRDSAFGYLDSLLPISATEDARRFRTVITAFLRAYAARPSVDKPPPDFEAFRLL